MEKIQNKRYRIIYTFNHPTMGFQNSSTVQGYGLTLEIAMASVKNDVNRTFGSLLSEKFSFKPDPTCCGDVVG